MSAPLIALALFGLALATPAAAHTLDEYLQATTLSVQPGFVGVEMRLTPGVDVFDTVMAQLDADGDGTLSDAEQRGYAERVLRDVSLTIDGQHAQLRLVASRFPAVEAMQSGMGEILLEYVADVAPGRAERQLIFENHHERAIAAYLANCLVPSDASIRITGQKRNYEQSVYRIDYAQVDAAGGVRHIRSGYDRLLFVLALVLAAMCAYCLCLALRR